MTKAGFLTKLADALRAISPADREAALAYFTEQLDDRIEEGMTEAKAVDSLGDFREIVAALLEEAASAQAAAAQAIPSACPHVFSDRGKSNHPELHEFTADHRPRTIELTETNCAVELLPALDGKLRIEYEVTRWINVDVSCDDDRLVYTAQEIFHLFHFDVIGRKPVKLYLPANYLPNLEIKTGNAKLSVADISCDTANFKTGNASIALARLTANNLTAKTGNAAITAEHITANLLKLTTSNGAINTAHCTADSLLLKTSNSAIRTEHCTANAIDAVTSNGKNTAEHITAAAVSLTSANGAVSLKNTTANDVTLRTSNASIVAILPGSIADYRIESKTVNGKSSLPSHKAKGEKSLNVTTSNGKIDVVFAEDQ